jgi:hypothetical protein
VNYCATASIDFCGYAPALGSPAHRRPAGARLSSRTIHRPQAVGFESSEARPRHPGASAQDQFTQGTLTMSTKDVYIAKMKLQLDELNVQMSKLEAKATQAKLNAQEKYKEEMTKLRQQSKVAKGKLDEIMAAGEDNWETMVTEMEKIRDAFTHSFSYFKSQI